MKSSILPLFLFRLFLFSPLLSFIETKHAITIYILPKWNCRKRRKKKKKKGKQTNKPRASGNPKRFIFVCDAQIHSLVSSTIAGNGKPLPMSIN